MQCNSSLEITIFVKLPHRDSSPSVSTAKLRLISLHSSYLHELAQCHSCIHAGSKSELHDDRNLGWLLWFRVDQVTCSFASRGTERRYSGAARHSRSCRGLRCSNDCFSLLLVNLFTI